MIAPPRAQPRTLGLPLFRKDFVLRDKAVASATLFISGLGTYVASINGRRAGDNYLGSGWTKFDTRVFYDAIDVSDYLSAGQNTVGIELGQGIFNGMRQWTTVMNQGSWDGLMRTRAVLQVTYEDGTIQSVNTGTDWNAAEGPSIPFTTNVIPENEGYDAHRAMAGWNRPRFDDSRWAPAVEVGNGHAVLQSNPVQPARVTDTFVAPQPTSPAAGVYLYSLGRNISGNARVSFDVSAGTSVRIRYGETLADGRIAVIGTRFQDDTYISDGSGPVTWTPKFSVKGFEYIEISGLPMGAAPPEVTVLRIHNDLRSIGTFDSSDKVLNFVDRAGRSTVLNNLVAGVPTDGSYVEKLPWLGDSALMAEANMRNFDSENLYVKFFNDLADSQDANGDMPAWAPSPTTGAQASSAAWGNAFTEVALLLIQNFGADAAVAARYSELMRYAQFLASVADAAPEQWGDWVCVDGDAVCNTPDIKRAVGRAYAFQSMKQFSMIAAHLGHAADAQLFETSAEAARKTFNRSYFDASSRTYRAVAGDAYNETLNVLPVAFGIANPADRQAIADGIEADVISRDHHLSTGVLGTKWLFRVLTAYGHVDTAYKTAVVPTAPGYGYWQALGATTLWEDWTPSPRSRSHPFLGSTEDWLLADVAGLTETGLNSNKVVIRPYIPKGLDRASTSIETSGGKAGSSWTLVSGKLTLAVDIPVNRIGEIRVPISAGQCIKAPLGAVPHGISAGYATYTVPSGHYVFSTAGAH